MSALLFSTTSTLTFRAAPWSLFCQRCTNLSLYSIFPSSTLSSPPPAFFVGTRPTSSTTISLARVSLHGRHLPLSLRTCNQLKNFQINMTTKSSHQQQPPKRAKNLKSLPKSDKIIGTHVSFDFTSDELTGAFNFVLFTFLLIFLLMQLFGFETFIIISIMEKNIGERVVYG